MIDPHPPTPSPRKEEGADQSSSPRAEEGFKVILLACTLAIVVQSTD